MDHNNYTIIGYGYGYETRKKFASVGIRTHDRDALTFPASLAGDPGVILELVSKLVDLIVPPPLIRTRGGGGGCGGGGSRASAPENVPQMRDAAVRRSSAARHFLICNRKNMVPISVLF